MRFLLSPPARFALNLISVFFFFNDTATTEIYTLSLHDALPILESRRTALFQARKKTMALPGRNTFPSGTASSGKIGEHTSELQSHSDLVCRLLLEKKKENE